MFRSVPQVFGTVENKRDRFAKGERNFLIFGKMASYKPGFERSVSMELLK